MITAEEQLLLKIAHFFRRNPGAWIPHDDAEKPAFIHTDELGRPLPSWNQGAVIWERCSPRDPRAARFCMNGLAYHLSDDQTANAAMKLFSERIGENWQLFNANGTVTRVIEALIRAAQRPGPRIST